MEKVFVFFFLFISQPTYLMQCQSCIFFFLPISIIIKGEETRKIDSTNITVYIGKCFSHIKIFNPSNIRQILLLSIAIYREFERFAQGLKASQKWKQDLNGGNHSKALFFTTVHMASLTFHYNMYQCLLKNKLYERKEGFCKRMNKGIIYFLSVFKFKANFFPQAFQF